MKMFQWYCEQSVGNPATVMSEVRDAETVSYYENSDNCVCDTLCAVPLMLAFYSVAIVAVGEAFYCIV